MGKLILYPFWFRIGEKCFQKKKTVRTFGTPTVTAKFEGTAICSQKVSASSIFSSIVRTDQTMSAHTNN